MKKFMVMILALVVGLTLTASAGMPMKGTSLKYGAGDEAVFTSGVRIFKIFFTGQTAATQCDLYNAVTKTGSPLLKFEAPTSDKTEVLDFGPEGAVFSTGLYLDVTNATDNYTVVYS